MATKVGMCLDDLPILGIGPLPWCTRNGGDTDDKRKKSEKTSHAIFDWCKVLITAYFIVEIKGPLILMQVTKSTRLMNRTLADPFYN